MHKGAKQCKINAKKDRKYQDRGNSLYIEEPIFANQGWRYASLLFQKKKEKREKKSVSSPLVSEDEKSPGVTGVYRWHFFNFQNFSMKITCCLPLMTTRALIPWLR